jgi:hypothetical protein
MPSLVSACLIKKSFTDSRDQAASEVAGDWVLDETGCAVGWASQPGEHGAPQ